MTNGLELNKIQTRKLYDYIDCISDIVTHTYDAFLLNLIQFY
jgi:hypothetical protein